MENRLSGTTSGIMMADISRDNNSHIKYPLKFIKRMEVSYFAQLTRFCGHIAQAFSSNVLICVLGTVRN